MKLHQIVAKIDAQNARIGKAGGGEEAERPLIITFRDHMGTPRGPGVLSKKGVGDLFMLSVILIPSGQFLDRDGVKYPLAILSDAETMQARAGLAGSTVDHGPLRDDSVAVDDPVPQGMEAVGAYGEDVAEPRQRAEHVSRARSLGIDRDIAMVEAHRAAMRDGRPFDVREFMRGLQG